MEEDKAIEWVQARTSGFLLFPFLILCQLSKAFEEKNLLVGAGIRGAYIPRSLSKKGRQQLTLHLYGLLSPVQGEEWLELEEDAQKAYVMGLLDRLEVVSRERRLKVARAVLYLAQGEQPPLPT